LRADRFHHIVPCKAPFADAHTVRCFFILELYALPEEPAR
jgi:hypothetical protein